MFLLAHCRWVKFREEERLLPSDRNSTLMTQNLSRIRSEPLIGRRSSFIIFAIVYEWQTKDKRPQRRNERRWISDKIVNIWVFWSSFADEQNTSPKSTRRNANIEQIYIWNPMIPWIIIALCSLPKIHKGQGMFLLHNQWYRFLFWNMNWGFPHTTLQFCPPTVRMV